MVFASSIGTPLDRHNVLREFRKITEAAGLGTEWVPRELRHTFVSLLSSDGMPLEDIADLIGHKGTVTTETVYRKVIVPELRRGRSHGSAIQLIRMDGRLSGCRLYRFWRAVLSKSSCQARLTAPQAE